MQEETIPVNELKEDNKVLVDDVSDSDDEVADEPTSKNEETEEAEETSKNKFEKIISDFVRDLKTSFPEFEHQISAYYDEKGCLKTDMLYHHCKAVYPERFFDFLYKNEESISDESLNTEILPSLQLKAVWGAEGITDSIKDTIWKYLQLVLFSIVGDVDDKNIFGNTAKMFETVDEDELKHKMEDTMKDLFELFQNGTNNEDDENADSKEAPEFLNPENMQEHISSLLGGKLGQLATEIAEETAKEFEMDMDGATDSQDVMKKLLSNPQKLMNLVKKVGGKLDDKMKSGDINEGELMKEAGELMKKMNGMPGMSNISDILKNVGASKGDLNNILQQMGVPNGGKNAKMNMSAYNNLMRKQEAVDKVRSQAKAQVEKRREQQRLKEEMEERKRNHVTPTNDDIDTLLKQLNLEDDETSSAPVKSSSNKKKKKKNKK
jgi:hypothetical protein